MDLTLTKNAIKCYEQIFDYSAIREETAETVVPDTMPDIERVLCADGVVIIRSKEAEAGSVTVTGGVAASVLYVPEDGGSARCITAALPFTCQLDAPDVTRECVPMAMLRLCSVEARMLNPRKLLIRAGVQVTVQCYEPAEMELNDGLEGDVSDCCEKLIVSETVSPVVCAMEKTFVVSDEFRPGAGQPPVASLLRHGVCLRCDDVRCVGTKLIVKGRARVDLTYLSDTGCMCQGAFETEFSQIIETDLDLKAPECRVWLLLTAEYVEAGSLASGEKGVTAELHLVAQAVCRDNVKLSYMTDCYSNKRRLRCGGGSVPASCAMGKASSRETVREAIDLPGTVAEVTQVIARTGQTETEGGRAVCPLYISALYLDAAGDSYGVSRKFSASWEPSAAQGSRFVSPASDCGEVYAAPTGKGIELRIPVDFEALLVRDVIIEQIDSVELMDDEGERETEALPSLTVVRAGEDTSLWQLGKRFHSTARAISQVNELEEDSDIAGRILLIPVIK